MNTGLAKFREERTLGNGAKGRLEVFTEGQGSTEIVI